MLPTGHVAAGFLTAQAVIHFIYPNFSIAEQRHLLWWGMFSGFAPDLDEFYYFFRNGNLLVSGEEVLKKSHRQYVSHVPVLWFIGGLLMFFLASTPYWKAVGLLWWLGSWSHFILDSIELGIMWLWPLSNRLFAFKNRGVKAVIQERRFFWHSVEVLKAYSSRLSFYLEVLIIIGATYIYLKIII